MELVDFSHTGNVLKMKSTVENLNTNVTFGRFTKRMSLIEQLLQFNIINTHLSITIPAQILFKTPSSTLRKVFHVKTVIINVFVFRKGD